jgi:hypothetical protein
MSRTNEGELSLHAEKKEHPPAGRRADPRAPAMTALAPATAFALGPGPAGGPRLGDHRRDRAARAQVNVEPLPSSAVTLSDARIAEIKG